MLCTDKYFGRKISEISSKQGMVQYLLSVCTSLYLIQQSQRNYIRRIIREILIHWKRSMKGCYSGSICFKFRQISEQQWMVNQSFIVEVQESITSSIVCWLTVTISSRFPCVDRESGAKCPICIVNPRRFGPLPVSLQWVFQWLQWAWTKIQMLDFRQLTSLSTRGRNVECKPKTVWWSFNCYCRQHKEARRQAAPNMMQCQLCAGCAARAMKNAGISDRTPIFVYVIKCIRLTAISYWQKNAIWVCNLPFFAWVSAGMKQVFFFLTGITFHHTYLTYS